MECPNCGYANMKKKIVIHHQIIYECPKCGCRIAEEVDDAEPHLTDNDTIKQYMDATRTICRLPIREEKEPKESHYIPYSVFCALTR